MVVGVGVDTMKLTRLQPDAMVPGDAFYERAFTDAEKAQAETRRNAFEYLSARFCAKEAVYKAISDCGEEFHPGDIEILDDKDLHPRVSISGKTAREIAAWWGSEIMVLVSITHEDGMVSAFAVAQRI